MKLLLGVIGIFFLIVSSQAFAQDVKGFRRIDIPEEEHGYQHFESLVIDSREQFDAFVKQIEMQSAWNDREGFLKAIRDAKVNFARESLVLIRQTEGSASIKLELHTDELRDDKLVLRIQRLSPSGSGISVVAFYCFALAVDKDWVKQVEVWVIPDSQPREFLEIQQN
jgi:hypothetical protein